MILWLRKYYPAVLLFGLIFAVLVTCNLPGLTWINTDSDGAHYVLSSKYFGVAHNTSAPLYLIIGRVFLLLPLGTDAWRMGLISVIATTVCSILIYLILRRQLSYTLNNETYAMIAAFVYGGSALVITQSTIIETYALSTCLAVASYYMCMKRKWVMASVLLGAVLAIHPLFFVMTWTVLIFGYKQLRNFKMQFITFAFLLVYAYIPISRIYGEVPAMWGNASFTGFFKNNFGTMWMLAGGLSLYDLPKRIIDTILILGISMGLGFGVVVWYFIKKRTFRSKLLWLFVIPVFYFIINLSAETYVYMVPAIAFGSIALGQALSNLNIRWAISVFIIAAVMFVYNGWTMDIGRTLDPNLSAQKYYNEELPKLEDGDIYLGGGWTWAIVYLYNKEEGRDIIPICTDILPSEEYLTMLEANGIKLTRTTSESFIDKQWEVAQSIAEQNPNVWISEETNPRTFEYRLVPADSNMHLITRWLGKELDPVIQWKPSNPYDYITGALEVSEWKFILMTNHNARFAIVCIIYSMAAWWLVEKLFGITKKKKTAVSSDGGREASGYNK